MYFPAGARDSQIIQGRVLVRYVYTYMCSQALLLTRSPSLQEIMRYVQVGEPARVLELPLYLWAYWKQQHAN
jgi:hypothetical protein